MEYGYYLFYYLYWYSDPNSTTGREDIGWIEIDSSGSAISTLITAGNASRIIDVPTFVSAMLVGKVKLTLLMKRAQIYKFM